MLNQVNLIGNLSSDVETKYTPSGACIATFGLATNRRYTKDGEKKEDVQFHNITVFGKLGEICGKYLTKGARTYISGRIEYQQWEKDGVKKYRTIIVGEDMKMLSQRDGNTDNRPASGTGQNTPAPANDFDDDIPF